MAVETKDGKHRVRLLLAAALLGLAAPFASAGPAEDAEQAEKEFARGNLVTALSLWRKAAESGHAVAQARLGDVLDKADEDEEAVKWYRKSAEQGEPAGEFGLGGMYAKGEGVKQDYGQALKYISSAASKDFLPAMVVMRDIYKNGSHEQQANKAKFDEWDAKVRAIAPVEALPDATEKAPSKRRRR